MATREAFSLLFWPVRIQGDTVFVLDETLLPGEVRYLKVKDYRQAATLIRQMKTRAVGQVLLVFYTFLLALRQAGGLSRQRRLTLLRRVADSLNATRPTLPFKALTDMVLAWAAEGSGLQEKIEGFLSALRQARIRQAGAAARLIRDNDCILTHCNVSGLLPLTARFCRRQKKRVSFFVTETRPYLQGARLSAWELQRAGFRVTIIADSMVAQVMSEGRITKVIVGADHLAQNGDIANKIGTLQIALLARHFRIPFLVLCPPASGTRSGRDIRIEVRPDKELLEFAGRRFAPSGVRGYYPAFDVTPHGLITRHIPLEV